MSDAPAPLHRTPLYDWHVAHHGRMVEFGGWEMPVQYTSIVEEHHAVRRSAGLFDISHMGRLRFRGPQACEFLDHVLTNDVSRLKVGQVRYSLVCNQAGGVLDDVLVYRLPDAYWLVVNASNRLKIVGWLRQHQGGADCEWEDVTLSTGMLALQGPRAVTALTDARAATWAKLSYYSVVKDPGIDDDPHALLSRTGYTGEDGCEWIVAADRVQDLWEQLLQTASLSGATLQPCGLGARDTLRLEAAMPLYGHELSESIDPLTAGLEFAVKLNKTDFIGKEALLEISRRTDRLVRVGLELAGRRIAREGCAVYVGDALVGEVTSGTLSPTLERSIAMAYLSPTHSGVGTAIEIDVRGKRETACVAALPFYKRPR